MADQGQYTPLGAILNDIQAADELDGNDKQFLTQFFAVRARAAAMPEGKVRAYRAKMEKASGGAAALRMLAWLWLHSGMAKNPIKLEEDEELTRLNMKRIASRAGLDKRDAHAILFLVALSLPGLNGGSIGGVQ